MKKLLSIFLANLVLIFDMCSASVLAGGIDKKENLSDGDRLPVGPF